MSHEQAKIPATLISGDGIGPEIVDAVVAVLDAVGSPFEWDRQYGGLAGISVGATRYPRRPWIVSEEHASRLKGHLPPRSEVDFAR